MEKTYKDFATLVDAMTMLIHKSLLNGYFRDGVYTALDTAIQWSKKPIKQKDKKK